MATADSSRMNLIVSLFLDEYDALEVKGPCPVEVLYRVGFSGKTGSLTVPLAARMMAMAVYSGWIEPFLIIDRVSRDPLLRVMCPGGGDPRVTEIIEYPGGTSVIDLLEDLANEYAETRLIQADRLPGFGSTPLFEIPDNALSDRQKAIARAWWASQQRPGNHLPESHDEPRLPGGNHDIVEMGWDTV